MSYLFGCYARFYDRFMRVWRLDDLEPVLACVAGRPPMLAADIGGGTGRLAQALCQRGHQVTIVDPCRSMTRIAKRREPRLAVIDLPLAELTAPEGFDCVILRDCLHHLPDQQAAVAKCAALLRPEGVLIIQDFVPESTAARRIFAFERFCWERVQPISPERLQRLCQEAGLGAEYRLLNERDYILEARKAGER